MTRLTEAQRGLLTRAASEGGAGGDAAAEADIKSLIRRGLLLAGPEGEGSRLIITEKGRSAAGIEPAAESPPKAGPPASQSSAAGEEKGESGTAKEPAGKIGVLLTLLRRPEGASLDQMTAATGWQAHSVRGALSGAIKKKLKLGVSSEKTADGRVYRLVEGEGA